MDNLTPEQRKKNMQTAFDNQQSTWERVKGGFSAVNSFNSNMKFTKGFGNLEKVTGFVDKIEKKPEKRFGYSLQTRCDNGKNFYCR